MADQAKPWAACSVEEKLERLRQSLLDLRGALPGLSSRLEDGDRLA